MLLLGLLLTQNRMALSSKLNAQIAFLPLILGYEQGALEEMRGIWVTRFDWMELAAGSPADLDAVVDDIASARFNAIFFQVRGVADAFYTPGLEPWSQRLTGTLGEDPGWDPLQYLIEKAHARNIEVHAYLNVYPVWTGCDRPADGTTPRHLYHLLLDAHGESDSKPNGLQWDSAGHVYCSVYQRLSPASTVGESHLIAVISDLVKRFDIDGVHLDHMRYEGQNGSCDPVSESQYGATCFSSENYKDWQRRQINDTLRKIYSRVHALDPDLWITAAVWPVYRDEWGWGASSGYDDYYQDSKGWMAAGIIDGIMPMIYTGNPNCDQPYFWKQERWRTLVEDFQAAGNGRMVIPGIGINYCTPDDFAEIEARINLTRQLETAGHALFSYRSLAVKGYFDDLRDGPYRRPAVLPQNLSH